MLTLSDKCVTCSHIFSVQIISESAGPDTTEPVELICPGCATRCRIMPRHVNGDPRNQAVVIHEDAWAPHATSVRHSVAAITITHGCMTKLERSSSANARVYSFIPVDQLPKKCPQPLFMKLEALYMDGQEVFFKSAVHVHVCTIHTCTCTYCT